MKKIEAIIKDNGRVCPGFYKISVKSDYLGKTTKPGQFFEVRCPDDAGVFLRRPLGAHRINKDGVEMLYEVVGRGTKALTGAKSGQKLDIIGPLGNGFDVSKKGKKDIAIIVGGGIGVAPLVALAGALTRTKDVVAIIGACKKSHVLCEPDMKKAGAKVLVATEDGSKGKRGLVTDLLTEALESAKDKSSILIYACGPRGMLKAVANIASKHSIPCQVSMEEHMACGIGVCLGCPVKMRDGGYKMVCKDGPVFDAGGIAW